MEIENGNSDLTYRYSYAEQKANVVVYGVPSGPNSLLELQNYPTGPQNIVKLHYHHDRLGSIDYLTDNLDNEIAGYATYDDWGQLAAKVIIHNGARLLDLVMEYTVHPYDQVLDLYYAKARMYDAADRRFMSVDPLKGNRINPVTYNQYVYCLDNSLRWVDLFGLYTTEFPRATPLGNGKYSNVVILPNGEKAMLQDTLYAKSGYVKLREILEILSKHGHPAQVDYNSKYHEVSGTIENTYYGTSKFIFYDNFTTNISTTNSGIHKGTTDASFFASNKFLGYFTVIKCDKSNYV
ncbi:MAG: hypothetical protein FWF85_04595 [Clostridiales bacterium]|nr:hypothetical protein [Clostridiales bacterium]